MMYSIIDTSKGEQHGLLPHLHNTVLNGTKMVVNENELRLVNSDIEAAAAYLGGTLLTLGEVKNEMQRLKYYSN